MTKEKSKQTSSNLNERVADPLYKECTFEGKIYKQNDGVAMASPLGPVLTGIVMVEKLLQEHMKP